jgi:hypothetical protein
MTLVEEHWEALQFLGMEIFSSQKRPLLIMARKLQEFNT